MASDTVRRWLGEMKAAENREREWRNRAEKVVERYRDERNNVREEKRRKINILWSNTEILKPAVFARTPKPEVSRRHLDSDPVGRAAALTLNRALDFVLEDYDFDTVMRRAVEDQLLPGRGVVRVFYRATMEEVLGADGDPVLDEDGDPIERVTDEEVLCRYINWKDFFHGFARTWEEVPWVCFVSRLTKEEGRRRFGRKFDKVPLEQTKSDDNKDLPESERKGEVWEIWSKEDKKVFWISPNFKEDVLDEVDDPLRLDGFFPCPRPLYSFTTNDSLVPIPEFTMYQDQADEVDDITARIALLTKALSVSGVYAGQQKAAIEKLVKSEENTLIPVDDWAMFSDSGGLRGMIDYLPIEQIIQTLTNLVGIRETIKRDLFEVTGISDIIRGSTNPNETAAAQRIKGQFATVRLQDRQDEVQRFARDLVRLKAEILAEQFEPARLRVMSGFDQLPEIRTLVSQVEGDTGQILEALFERIKQLLEDEKTRGFRITVQTDSTVAVDKRAEQQSRIEMFNAIGSYLGAALPTAQQAPELGPFLLSGLRFLFRTFPDGKTLEPELDRAVDALERRLLEPGDDFNADKERIDQKERESEREAQIEREKMQADAFKKAAELAVKLETDD